MIFKFGILLIRKLTIHLALKWNEFYYSAKNMLDSDCDIRIEHIFFDCLKHENMCEIIETNFNLLETYVRWCSIFFLMMTYKRNVIQVNEYVFNAY